MALQSTVNLYPAIAVQGDKASENIVAYTPINYIAGADVPVGSFVWASVDDETQAVNSSDESVAPLGFVQRVHANYNYVLNSEGSLTVPQYGALTVATRGDFWAVSSTDAERGQAVFASLSDGSIQTADSGSSVSGYIETGFIVEKGADAGEVILISNWRS